MDGLKEELGDRVTVLEINLLSDIGRQVAAAYGVRIVPVTLVLDERGRLIYRHTGIPDGDTIADHLSQLPPTRTQQPAM